MKRITLSTLVALLLVTGAMAQDSAEPTTTQSEEKPSSEVTAIRAAIASYVAAFNKHDAKLVASHWTPEGEFITPSGKALVGRANLEAEFAAYFKETKEAKLTLGEPTIQLLSPGVGVEHGSALVVTGDGDTIETDYEAIHLKTADGWKMDSVREKEYVRPQSHYDHLKELEWMVGEWVDSDENATIETSCQWTKNGNFMTRSFKVYVEDRIDLEGTQVIGYDPALKTIRSWVFDSEGGFGVGMWSRSGDQWTISGLRVLPDGRRASATSVMRYIDDNTFTLHTIGRQIDGELMPNIGPIKVVRK